MNIKYEELSKDSQEYKEWLIENACETIKQQMFIIMSFSQEPDYLDIATKKLNDKMSPFMVEDFGYIAQNLIKLQNNKK